MMIKRFTLIVCIAMLTINLVEAQKKFTLDNVGIVYLRSTGSIIENNVVKGYFFMYVSDKIDRKTNLYNLQILDQNLNSVKNIPFEGSKDVTLMEAAYNGNTLAFLFNDEKKKTMQVQIYGTDGSLKNSYTRDYDTRSLGVLTASEHLEKERAVNEKLFAIGENGYVGIYPKQNGLFKYSYEIEFYTLKEKKQWTFTPQDEEPYVFTTMLGYTGNVVLFNLFKRSSMGMNGTTTSHIQAFDITSQKKIFDVDNTDEKYTMTPSNITPGLKEGELTITGVYTDKKALEQNAKHFSSLTNGLAVCTIDSKGKVLSKVYNSWKEDLSKFIPVDEEGKFGNAGYLMFQTLVRSNDKFFVIGEGYQKNLLTDMITIELNSQGKVDKASVFPKTHNKVSISSGMFTSLSASAVLANYMGEFDYQFIAPESGNTGFSVLYKDYVRKEGDKNMAYGALHYNGTSFITDKIKLESKADVIKIYPAKAGSIMVLEYFEKSKKLELRLEKIG